MKELYEDSPDDGTEKMAKIMQDFIEGENKNHTFLSFIFTPEKSAWFAKNVDLKSEEGIAYFENIINKLIKSMRDKL